MPLLEACHRVAEALARNDHDDAAQKLSALFAKADGDAEPLLSLAALCIEHGDDEWARRLLERAVFIDPESLGAWELLALVLQRQDLPLRAIDALHTVTDLAPNMPAAHYNLGAGYLRSGDPEPATAALRTALRLRPEYFEAWRDLGRAYACMGRLDEATRAVERGLELEPQCSESRALHRELLGAQVFPYAPTRPLVDPSWEAYDGALRRAIDPTRNVLCLGAGPGVLAMMAARAGAARVVTCEPNRALSQICRTTFERNGLHTKIDLVQLDPTALRVGSHLRRRADVLVTQLQAPEQLADALLPSLAHARVDLIHHAATVIPHRVSNVTALVCSAELEATLFPSDVEGFDLTALQRFTPRAMAVELPHYDARFLSGNVTSFGFDLRTLERLEATAALEYVCQTGGRCVGIAQWLRAELDLETTIEADPLGRCGISPTILYPFERPLDLRPGDRVRVTCRYEQGTLHYQLVGTPGAD